MSVNIDAKRLKSNDFFIDFRSTFEYILSRFLSIVTRHTTFAAMFLTLLPARPGKRPSIQFGE
jgi:hypothetical protein